MARRKRGRPRGAALRRKRAVHASEQLSEILVRPWDHSTRTVDAASTQMWNIGTSVHDTALVFTTKLECGFVVNAKSYFDLV